jgi:hypothetical protein
MKRVMVLYLGSGSATQKDRYFNVITQETLCKNSAIAFSRYQGAHIATFADRAQPINIDLDKNSVKSSEVCYPR